MAAEKTDLEGKRRTRDEEVRERGKQRKAPRRKKDRGRKHRLGTGAKSVQVKCRPGAHSWGLSCHPSKGTLPLSFGCVVSDASQGPV